MSGELFEYSFFNHNTNYERIEQSRKEVTLELTDEEAYMVCCLLTGRFHAETQEGKADDKAFNNLAELQSAFTLNSKLWNPYKKIVSEMDWEKCHENKEKMLASMERLSKKYFKRRQ